MNSFANSHLGKLRKIVGNQLLLVPGTKIIIQNSAGEILLQLRADFKVWGLPAGISDPGEDIVDTIIREVKEETSLTIFNPVPFGFSSNPKTEMITYPNGDQIHGFVLNFICNTYQGEAKISDDESLELRWFPTDQLPQMLPNMLASVHAYRKFQATGEFQLF